MAAYLVVSCRRRRHEHDCCCRRCPTGVLPRGEPMATTDVAPKAEAREEEEADPRDERLLRLAGEALEATQRARSVAEASLDVELTGVASRLLQVIAIAEV